MSGVKTTTIDTYELNQLRRAASQCATIKEAYRALERINASLAEAVNDSQSRITALNTQINNARKENNALSAQLQQTINNTRQQFVIQEQRHNAQISAMQSNFDQAIKDTYTNVADLVHQNNRVIEQTIQQNNDQLRHEMDQLHNDMQNQIDTIHTQVAAAAKNDQDLYEMAQTYYSETQNLLEEISQYRCELLLPGRLAATQAVVNQAVSDIHLASKNPAHSSVSMNNARIAFEDALRLYADIVNAEHQWQLIYENATQAVLQAQAVIDQNANIHLNAENYDVDVNHWSNGDFAQLQELGNSYEARVSDGAREESIEDLDALFHAATQLSDDVQDTAAIALGLAICHQDRVDASDDLAEELFQRHGLVLEDHGFEGSDERAAHRVSVKDPHRNIEVILTQIPQVDDNGNVSSRLETDVVAPDGIRNQEELDNLVCVILETIQACTNTDADICTVAGYETKPSDRFNNQNHNEFYTQKQPTTIPRPAVAQRRKEKANNPHSVAK